MGAMWTTKAPTAAMTAGSDAQPLPPPWSTVESLVRLRCLIDAGDLETVQALVERDWRFHWMHDTSPFEVACERGQLHIAQWLLDRDRERIMGHRFDRALRLACGRGHVGVTEWLLALARELPYRYNVDVLFASLCGCEHGSLDILQCLRARVPHLDIHAYHEDAFAQACEHGRIAVAQWLIAQGGVDIHARHDAAFVLACMNRRLRTAQWLWSLGGVDPHTLDGWLTRSCKVWRYFRFNGRSDPLYMALKVCQWVFRLDPREAAWPKDMVDFVKRWSPDRDAWMRSVCARVPKHC